MNKKFKNTFAVTGSKSLLKAFEEELEVLGYEICKQSCYKTEKTIVNNWRNNINKISYAVIGHPKIASVDHHFILPQDWNKALELAAEVEEEIPEYIEATNNCSVYYIKGYVYKVLDTKNLSSVRLTCSKKTDWANSETNLYVDFNKAEWKASTKEAYEAQFELKPEVGKWYGHKKYPKLLVYCKEISSQGNIIGYGFDLSGKWVNYKNTWLVGCLNHIVYEATEEQVKIALVEEAVRRGFVQGVFLAKIGINKSFSCSSYISGKFTWFASSNVLDSGNGAGHIFNNGIWAEIKKEVVINGYPVTEVSKDTVKVGCKSFFVEDLIKLRDFLNRYNGAYTIENKSWTYGDVNEVIQEFKKM
jgi:hypothetical protein